MKYHLLKRITIAVTLACGLTAAQAQTADLSHRPAAVPAAYVVTPFGYFDPSCVEHLAPGDELRSDQSLIRHADGTTMAMRECGFPHYRADGAKVEGDERAVKDPNISHAWVEWAGVTNTTSYGRLFAEWTVPPTPTSKDGQTLFYFPGLQDLQDVVTILQPVLGWNSDYGSAWGIASWNCCQKGTVYESSPQHVSSGDTILGYIFDTCAAGTLTCKTWDIVTWDLQNGKFTQLINTSNFTQTFNWAFGGVLEVYNIKQCSDYPTNGTYWGSHSMSFNEVGLYDQNFNAVTNPNWTISTASGLSPACGYGGSVPKQIILNAN
jgi:hypothetical protein